MSPIFRILLLSMFLVSCGAKSFDKTRYDSFPSFEEIANFTCRNSSFESDEFPAFMKKPDGWWMCIRKPDDEGNYFCHEEPILIWSAEENQFMLPKKAMLKPGWESKAEMAIRNGGYGFQNNLYFGYAGWSHDVIEGLEGANLTDTLTYYLARAYSQEGLNICSPGQTFIDPMQKTPDAPVYSITKSDAEAAAGWYRKSHETFRKLAEMNPAFQTVVGSPTLKASNEAITAWYELTMLGMQEVGQPFLKEAAYLDYYSSFAKNTLASCPPNAILFAGGDNDTYTLLWEQEVNHYREDVTIVNLSLLNTSKYYKYLTERLPEPRRLTFRFSLAAMESNKSEYVGVGSGNSESSTDVAEWIQVCAAALSKGMDSPLPAGTLFWKMQADSEDRDETNSPANIKIRTRGSGRSPYLLRQDILLLDLLVNYYGKRPICFPATLAPSDKLGLDDALWQTGLVAEIRNVQSVSSRNSTLGCNVDFARHLELVQDKFNYSGLIKGLPVFTDQDYQFGIGVHSNIILSCMEACKSQNDTVHLIVLENRLKEINQNVKVLGQVWEFLRAAYILNGSEPVGEWLDRAIQTLDYCVTQTENKSINCSSAEDLNEACARLLGRFANTYGENSENMVKIKVLNSRIEKLQ